MGGLTQDQLRSGLGLLPALLVLWVGWNNVLSVHRSSVVHRIAGRGVRANPITPQGFECDP